MSDDEFEVEKLLSIRRDVPKSKLSGIYVLIKWINPNNSKDISWQPLEDVNPYKSNEMLTDLMGDFKLKIPIINLIKEAIYENEKNLINEKNNLNFYNKKKLFNNNIINKKINTLNKRLKKLRNSKLPKNKILNSNIDIPNINFDCKNINIDKILNDSNHYNNEVISISDSLDIKISKQFLPKYIYIGNIQSNNNTNQKLIKKIIINSKTKEVIEYANIEIIEEFKLSEHKFEILKCLLEEIKIIDQKLRNIY